MKKLICLLVVACFTTIGVQAQDVSFGAKAGLNFANLSGDDVDLENVTSFHLGLVAEIMLTEKFAVQPEILYSGQGASEENYTLKLDYVTIPVMAKFFVAPGLSLEAGPQIAFNVLAEEDYDGDSEEIEDINSFDFGGGIGLGYEFARKIFVQARYVMGFTEIMDDTDVKNNVFQLSVGYKF